MQVDQVDLDSFKCGAPILVQFSSLTQLCLTLCDPMDRSMLGFPVHHQLSELTQTHIHQVDDTIQPSHLLLPVSPPALRLSRNQHLFQSRLFTSGGQSIGASGSASVLSMNIRDSLPLGLTGLISLQSKGHKRVFFSTIVQKHQFFSAQPSLWSNSHIHT